MCKRLDFFCCCEGARLKGHSKYVNEIKKMFDVKFLLVFLIITVTEKCNGEVNVTATRKCDEGWQGKDCEFCAGKIR